MGVVSNWDVKDFPPIACESFPVLKDEALCDVGNDQYYAYQICWSIIRVALDPDLQLPESCSFVSFKMADARLSNSEILRFP